MTRAKFRELLAVIARTGDTGMGLPEDHGVRSALISHGLATAAGLGAREVRDSVLISLLRFAG